MTIQQEFDGGDLPVQGRDRAFARAQRHSRRVGWLKIALPLVAAVTGIGFLVYSYVVSPASVAINVAESTISDGRLVMASPKLEGFTQDNRPYAMRATRAYQDLKDMGLIELEEISAELPFEGDTTATLSAPGGLYNRTKNTLDLKGDLNIRTSDGMTARLKSAFVDITAGSVSTDKPVAIDMKGASVAAKSLTVRNNGKIMVFDKGVRMVIDESYANTQPKANGG